MSENHVGAIYAQFPWLVNSLGSLKPYISHATVLRADTEVLDLEEGGTIGIGDDYSGSRIFLFNGDGALIATVHGTGWYARFCEHFGVGGSTFLFRSKRKKVSDVLIELGDRAYTCSYIVLVVDRCKITVFRAPKEGTIVDLLKRMKRKGAEQAEEALPTEKEIPQSVSNHSLRRSRDPGWDYLDGAD